jgi:hypothetical protein
MAGASTVNNDAHNTFIERTIGPEVFRIVRELAETFPDYFTQGHEEDAFPRFKLSAIPSDIQEFISAPEDVDPPQEKPKEAPAILIEGLVELMGKLKLTGPSSSLEDQHYFRALLDKTFQPSTHWNLFTSGIGSQTLNMSNQELLGLIFLGLKSLDPGVHAELATGAGSSSEMEVEPLAGAGGPGGGSSRDPIPVSGGGSSSGGASGGLAQLHKTHQRVIQTKAFSDQIEKLLNYLRHEEDLTANCGTRYRNSLMMFLQSAGFPGMAIVLSAKDFLSMTVKSFVGLHLSACFDKDKACYAKAILQTENTVEALFLLLNSSPEPRPPEFQLDLVKRSFKLFLDSLVRSKKFHFSPREWSEINALIIEGASFFDPLLEECPLLEKGAMLFDTHDLLSSGTFIPLGTFAYRGLSSKIHELTDPPRKVAGSYVQTPEMAMKELDDLARELRDIVDFRRTLRSRKLDKAGDGLAYIEKTNRLFSKVEESEKVSVLNLKAELSRVSTETKTIHPSLEMEIKARSSGLYNDIESIFALFFSQLEPEVKASQDFPSLYAFSPQAVRKFIALIFSAPPLRDSECDVLLKESVGGGHLEIGLYDLNRVLIHAMVKEDPTRWSPSFYAVFHKVLDLICRSFEGSAIAVSEGLTKGSYPVFLIESFKKMDLAYQSAMLSGGGGAGGGSGAGLGAGGKASAAAEVDEDELALLSNKNFLSFLLGTFDAKIWVLILNGPEITQDIRLALIESRVRPLVANVNDFSFLIESMCKWDLKAEAIDLLKSNRSPNPIFLA